MKLFCINYAGDLVMYLQKTNLF